MKIPLMLILATGLSCTNAGKNDETKGKNVTEDVSSNAVNGPECGTALGDCNTQKPAPEKSGTVARTTICTADKQLYYLKNGEVTCVGQGDSVKEQCNAVCQPEETDYSCNEVGGHPLFNCCELKGCTVDIFSQVSAKPTDSCDQGSSYFDGCNECICDAGKWYCDERECSDP